MDVPLIVVPNPSLLDNHQVELAEALQEQGYVVHADIKCVLSFPLCHEQPLIDVQSATFLKLFRGLRSSAKNTRPGLQLIAGSIEIPVAWQESWTRNWGSLTESLLVALYCCLFL
jgi:hypothetical protein